MQLFFLQNQSTNDVVGFNAALRFWADQCSNHDLGLNTCIKHSYIPGERLKDHWSSGLNAV